MAAAAAILSLHGAPQPGGGRLTVQVKNCNAAAPFPPLVLVVP